MQNLDKLQAQLKTGSEPLIADGNRLGFSLLDFWQWSVSDILSNATRGRFAEFIVATATGIDIKQVRDEWAAYDLETPDGIKIEVKSAAYLQSWYQKVLSKISFSIKPAFYWDYETNKPSPVAKRTADVYVFCLLHYNDKQTVNPLNLDHWEFYVVATAQLDSQFPNSGSISLNSLKKLTEEVSYHKLLPEINRQNNAV
ncbi:hypothetical protein [Mucilaginibacter terrae]|uniref:Restriction endonuclease n=1 Tax=Mucilaginibacter terrae TaxID=1955052 RepID=A0ABU3GXC8_9SPHI|nr:hypothetical protein [Mucilaginibacter terrae]MDT3404428.1 hypothetical protein [Mucilaginibacter terrae]